MIPLVVGVGISFVSAMIVKELCDYTEESHRRNRVSKLRKTKKVNYKIKQEIDVEALKRKRNIKKANEVRLDCLIEFYKTQLQLIRYSKNVLNEIKADTEDSVRKIKEALHDKNIKREYIHSDVWAELMDSLKSTKALSVDNDYAYNVLNMNEQNIQKNLEKYLEKKDYVRSRAGVEIKRIIQDFENSSLKYFKSSKLKNGIIRMSKLVLNLNKQCEKCGSWQDSRSKNCFCCGSKNKDANPGIELIWKKSDLGKTEQPCTKCGAPLSVEMVHCFNCGTYFDQYGFKKILDFKQVFKK